MPPRNIHIQNTNTEQVEHIAVDVECIITRVLPIDEVSVYWTKPSSEEEEEADISTTESNEDGTYELTYTTELVFTRKDHHQLLTCHATWGNIDDYSRVSVNVTVQCEYWGH